MNPEIERFGVALASTLIWSFVAIVLVALVFELMQRRYGLMREIFDENSTAAGILAASIILGISYIVVQIIIH
jgi:uncharacterized membrane protein YjfL (UPF0719 family)